MSASSARNKPFTIREREALMKVDFKHSDAQKKKLDYYKSLDLESSPFNMSYKVIDTITPKNIEEKSRIKKHGPT